MLALFLISLIEASACGIYDFKGMARIIDGHVTLVVNEKTNSEVVIKVTGHDEATLAPYVDLPFKGIVHTNKMPTPRQMQATKFSGLDYSVADPLNPMQNSYIKLKKGTKCL
ncbi:MAG: hypothetical protein K2P81_15115 [Bacteriovoracaceae bacterium]|nr:hypothetical protein [Bacteriovoracaceae bacterium]